MPKSLLSATLFAALAANVAIAEEFRTETFGFSLSEAVAKIQDELTGMEFVVPIPTPKCSTVDSMQNCDAEINRELRFVAWTLEDVDGADQPFEVFHLEAEVLMNSTALARVQFLHLCAAMFKVIRPDDGRSPFDLVTHGGIAAMNRAGDGFGQWVDDTPIPLLVVEAFAGASLTCAMTTDH